MKVLLLLLHVLWLSLETVRGDAKRLQVVTVATSETDGYERFMRSVRLFDLNVKNASAKKAALWYKEVVGMGQEWMGGDIIKYPGGGQKINLLRPVVELWKEQTDTVVMFVDSYDVIFTAGADVILEKFNDFNARVVFSAEGFCWPNMSLATKYPRVALGKRFLNSGGFIGYAPEIYQLIWEHRVEDTDDDQLYYTLLYLNPKIRDEMSMRLDHRAHIFQNLNGAQDEVELVLQENQTFLQNSMYDTRAVVYHGNGPSKLFLNSMANYVPSAWTESEGCLICKEWIRELPDDQDTWPTVMLGVFIRTPTPFLQDVLERIYKLDYPKSKMVLWVHNSIPYHEGLVNAWYELVSSDYHSCSYVGSGSPLREFDSKTQAMKHSIENKCDYYFSIDSVAMLDSADVLKDLLQIKRNVVSPLLTRHKKLFSNFWGDIASNGFYARSHDYLMIVDKHRRGVWNAPFISNAILFSGKWLQQLQGLPSYTMYELDPEMSFALWMRDNGHFMYTSNWHDSYGHLISDENFETTHLHNDMFSVMDNRPDWERRYLHENWTKVIEDDYVVEQPCPDVYWYPLMSETFTKELVEEMEHFGDWSSGKNNDERLDGGYENVPTRDIHMNQVGFEAQWLDIIKTYVVPVQLKVFPGYYSRAQAIMNFVVKYWPEGQHSLRAHHDSSTFTINVALSRPGVDFEGGGCRFVRYNCSVTVPLVGWSFMHPGRLTHFHEGLRVTKGTRYIMVSFIDP